MSQAQIERNFVSDPNPQPYQADQPPYQPSAQPYQADPQGLQPQPYGQTLPYGQPPPEHPQGTTILVLGIVGLFFTICAPIAWYMGSKAQKEIKASGLRYSNEQNITIGKIVGMVVTILAIIGLVIGILALVFFVILAASTAPS